MDEGSFKFVILSPNNKMNSIKECIDSLKADPILTEPCSFSVSQRRSYLFDKERYQLPLRFRQFLRLR